MRIGVIGDYDPRLPYHPATTAAIDHAAGLLGVPAEVEWVATTRLGGGARTSPILSSREPIEGWLSRFHGLVAGPGSPYRSFEGALRGIRFARENGKPFVGT